MSGLEIDSVSWRYGNRDALEDISLAVAPGTFCALLGPNGAGKTLDLLGLADRLGDRLRTLNGGHRRRLEIARALLHGPAVLLLDEPTVGLDVATRRTITDHVHALCGQTGVAVLWATHLVDEVRDGDAVVVLHRGRIAARGSASDIVAQAGAPDLVSAFSRLTDDAGEIAAQ